jgi:hypothetical protein
MHFQLAQVNIGRVRAPVDDPLMHGFVARLDEINALAESSPGFVWRLKDDSGNATYFRPYAGDDRILINMSVWESIEALHAFVYRSLHKDLLADRKNWFERMEEAYQVLWWIPRGHIPTLEEAVARLEHLRQHGDTPHAFGFKSPFEPPGLVEVAEAGAGS